MNKKTKQRWLWFIGIYAGSVLVVATLVSVLHWLVMLNVH